MIQEKADDPGEVLRVSHVSNFYDDGSGFLHRGNKGRQVLHDVSFCIRRNEFFGLVGESGCGKSTLGNAILGLIPFEGSVRLAGREASQMSRLERTSIVQAVFQDPMSSLNPKKTIGFTMREPLRAHRIGTAGEQQEAVRRMLERVGLDAGYALRYPRELSGGQRQRVCIGASLMLEPKLVIADEAVSALDVSVGAQILNLFQEIHDRRDFSMLFISHNMNVVYYLCDRIAVMYRGRIVELGTAQEVYRNPLHPYTKLLLSSVPDWNVPIEDEEALAGNGETPAWGNKEEPLEASEMCPDGLTMVNMAKKGEEEHLVLCGINGKKGVYYHGHE